MVFITDFDKVWANHCKDSATMTTYAQSMKQLADEWKEKFDGVDRIQVYMYFIFYITFSRWFNIKTLLP